ncbi:MAG: methylthioribulose 1-phosphate dehydratase [Gammaproteobacteria bacterium]
MSALAQQLVETCHFFGERQWCPATGGNFSARLDERHCLITRSGCDKSRLVTDDLITCNFDGEAIETSHRPSAETALHTRLYQLDDTIGCVLHTHSVNSTVLSRLASDALEISGYEMQKSLNGNQTHEEKISVAVFDNTQNIPALAHKVARQYSNGKLKQPGLLVRGHGLYAWGRDIDEARRHIEGFEFLFTCLLQEKLSNNNQ